MINFGDRFINRWTNRWKIKPAICQHPWNVETISYGVKANVFNNNRKYWREREVESSFADQRNDACMQACGMKPMPCIYIYVARNWVLIRRMTELAAFILMGRLRRCFTFIYRESGSPPFNFTAIEFKFLQLTCRVSSLFGEQYAGNSHLYEILKLFDSISQLHAN